MTVPVGDEPTVLADAGRTISSRGAAGVGIASIIAAASGFTVQLIAARTLDKPQAADFLIFWGLLFGLFGALGGVQNETTRAVSVGHRTGGARVFPFGLSIGVGVAAAVCATAWVWGPGVLGAAWASRATVVAVGVVAFAGHSTLVGALAGSRKWTSYSWVVGAESAVRLVLVAAVAISGTALLGLEIAVAMASAAWLVWMLVSSTVREAARARADVGRRVFAGNIGHAMIAAASSAALVVGFPILLRVTTPDAVFSGAAPLLFAISATRAPLLMPLMAYQGVAITHFLAHRGEGLGALRRIVGAILGVGAAAAVLAGLVGPWAMQVYGKGYRVDGYVLAALTFAAALLGVITLTGSAVLALGGHRPYALGWFTATLVSVAALLVPGSIELRSILALASGPLAGIAVHGWAVRQLSRQDGH
jgi:O-antigen/teichoic acid export membrane protein